MELTLRVLIAAALLGSVHARAAAVQENNPPSQAQAAAARDINTLIRQVLADRIPAKDIPDYGLLRGAKRITVRSDFVRFSLGQDALPALEGYELRLISTAEAPAEAERTQTNVYFIAIENLQIGADTAGLWIGVDFAMPSDPKQVKMCCCSRSLEYRRVGDRWVFLRWRDDLRCYWRDRSPVSAGANAKIKRRGSRRESCNGSRIPRGTIRTRLRPAAGEFMAGQ